MRFRTTSALIAAALTVPLLAACSQTPTCDLPSGDAVSVIDAPGQLGSKPRLSMPTPIVTDTSEFATAIEGDGDRIVEGQPVMLEVAMFNGTTGAAMQDTGYNGGILMTAGSDELPPISEALTCAREGSRSIIVGSALDSHGEQPVPSLGVAADDTVVFVVDVLETFLPKANGTPRVAKSGDPAVVLAPNGQPGVTMPKTEAPTEFSESVLKEGKGQTVEDGDQIVLHYSGFLWSDGSVFDSSWDRGRAATWELEEGALIEGFHRGLVGSTVGSQLLLVIPPELGYGDRASASIPAGSTLVFVVDVLGIAE